MNKNIIVLIDAYSYIYRIFYAKLNKKNKKYQSLNITCNVLYILKNILTQFKPKKLIIVFDTKGKNFRNKIFQQYKINRTKMPEELQKQIPEILTLLKKIGIPIISIPNFEADDIIGTLSKIAESHGDHVLIGTCDKDFAQLVNKNIYILHNIYHTILKTIDIKIQYGVPPKLIIDLLSLVGDISDNIPGVIGIGKKTAITLLNNIGNIKTIYNNFNKIKNLSLRGKKNIIDKLHKGKKMAFLSYQLAKINCNVNIIQQYKELNFIQTDTQSQLKIIKYNHIIKKINKIIIKNK